MRCNPHQADKVPHCRLSPYTTRIPIALWARRILFPEHKLMGQFQSRSSGNRLLWVFLFHTRDTAGITHTVAAHVRRSHIEPIHPTLLVSCGRGRVEFAIGVDMCADGFMARRHRLGEYRVHITIGSSGGKHACPIELAVRCLTRLAWLPRLARLTCLTGLARLTRLSRLTGLTGLRRLSRLPRSNGTFIIRHHGVGLDLPHQTISINMNTVCLILQEPLLRQSPAVPSEAGAQVLDVFADGIGSPDNTYLFLSVLGCWWRVGSRL